MSHVDHYEKEREHESQFSSLTIAALSAAQLAAQLIDDCSSLTIAGLSSAY
jgi:hypothetical protein